MTTYKLQIQSTVGGLTWAYDITQPSDKMALEFAERIARTDMAVRHAALALLIFNMDTEKLIGRFVYDLPIVRNTVE